jgi:hypothetical protein
MVAVEGVARLTARTGADYICGAWNQEIEVFKTVVTLIPSIHFGWFVAGGAGRPT